jgi:hypothetical protein
MHTATTRTTTFKMGDYGYCEFFLFSYIVTVFVAGGLSTSCVLLSLALSASLSLPEQT